MLQQHTQRHIPLTTIFIVAIAVLAILAVVLVPNLNRQLTVNRVEVNPVEDIDTAMAAHPLSPEAIALREQYEPTYKLSAYDAHPLSPEAIALREQYEPTYKASVPGTFKLSPEAIALREQYEPSYAP